VCTLLEETGEDTCIAFTLDDGSPAAQPSRPGLYHQQQQQQQRSAEAPTGASEQAGSIGPGEQAPALVEVSSPEVKPIVLDVLVPSLVVLFRWVMYAWLSVASCPARQGSSGAPTKNNFSETCAVECMAQLG
jgi:hypothetical protein